MTLKIIRGNIFTSKCQTLVNTINCVGVMGAGIALECRLRFPEMFDQYVQFCNEDKIKVGLLWVYKSVDPWILNFPTKKHWKYPSKEEYLHSGLKNFVSTYKSRGIKSIAFPLLGADKGGLAQDRSISIMQHYLSDLELDVEIYKYDPFSKDDLFDKTKDWMLSNSMESIVAATNLKRNYVEKAIEAFGKNDIFQLNQLASVDGIGIKTLEKIFMAAQNSSLESHNSLNEQGSLF